MKSKSGFTLVEILVIIAVIAILSTVALIGNQKVQQSARDSKRKADIVALANELEKYYERNGEYPRTCSNSSSYCPMASAFLYTTSLSATQAILSGIPNNFKDPLYTSGRFISYEIGSNDHAYFYFGGVVNTSTDTLTKLDTDVISLANANGNPSSISCKYTAANIPVGKNTTYLVGYYSEYDARFKIYSGGKGVQFTKLSGDSSCDLLPSF